MRSLKSRAPAPPGGRPGFLPHAPLSGSRSEAFRRLQMGAIGVVAVLLLIGLASIIKDRATQTDSTAVAGAAPTTAPDGTSAGADPLAEAGVLPDMPASPSSPEATPQQPGATMTGAAATPSPSAR